MFKFVTNFLRDAVINMLEYLMNGSLNYALDTALKPQSSMQGLDISSLEAYILGIGISYATMKFALKIFTVYMLWSDGDSDNPPHILLINYIKAIAFILAFSTIYDVFTDFMREFGQTIIGAISSVPTADVDNLVPENIGFFSIIMIIVGIICWIGTYFSALKSAVLLLVLKLGFPLIASGTMDSNGGMFSTYIPKFLQVAFSVVVKLALLKLGLVLLLNANPIWAIIVLTAGNSVNELLREFMLTTSGGGFGSKVSHATMTVSSLMRIFSKKG